MAVRLTTALCATAAIIALTAGGRPAAAQSDQSTASAGSGLEEIVVTARRREERLQTVPLAITAFTQVDIEKKHVEQLWDLSKVVPSLAVSQTMSDPNGFFSGQVRLRGLQGTEIYFADVPLSSTDSNAATGLTHGLSPGFYYDLDTVEVDKGAQGTLFGRPSIGGLISFQPKRPTNGFEGYIQTTFGDYGDKENEFAINIPVIEDKLLVRVSGQMQQRDGYTLNLQDGSYLDDRNYYAWRVGVTFRPTDDFENYLLYDGYWQDSHGGSNELARINPGFTFAQLPLPFIGNVPLTLANGPALTALENPATATATFLQLFGTKTAGGQPSLSFFPTLPQLLAQQQALGPRTILGRPSSEIGKDYFYGFTDIATWDITDDLSLKNIAAARVFKQLGVVDYGSIGLPLAIFGFPGNNHGWNNNEVQYTEEMQLSGKVLNDRLDWRVGGFLLFDHPLGGTTIVLDGLGSTIFNHYSESSRSQAVFAHGIYDLSDWIPNLRFTAGYRYTWDFDSLSERSTTPGDVITRGPGGVANDCNVPTHDNNCLSQVDGNFSSYGWNLGLDYQLTPQTLLYVRAGNAYRPGGSVLAVQAPYNKFQPEHVTDVELGVKTDYELMGIHGRTNADIYHTDYKAIQAQIVVSIPSQVPGGAPSVATVTANAASAYLEGAEIEQTFNLPYGFDLAAQGSYIYTHYDSYPQAFGQVGSPPFQYIPLFQFAVTPAYHVPIDPSWGELSASISWSWYGHQSTSPLSNEPLNYQPHYQNFDMRVDWTNIFQQPFDLAFFMTNVTDNVHIAGEIPLMTTAGFSAVSYNPPRMFGFSLKYRFEPNR